MHYDSRQKKGTNLGEIPGSLDLLGWALRQRQRERQKRVAEEGGRERDNTERCIATKTITATDMLLVNIVVALVTLGIFCIIRDNNNNKKTCNNSRGVNDLPPE